jgi:hypothetical protein
MNTWIGVARKSQQIATITVTSNTDAQTFTISFTHPSGIPTTAIEIATDTASSDTTSSIAANLQADIAASLHEYAKSVTSEVNAAVITLTANKAGVPFVVSVGGTGSMTLATTSANSGPNDYSVASNWSEGSVPVATNDVRIQGSVDILYGLNQASVALDDVLIEGFTGRIGSRAHPLAFDPGTLVVNCTGNVHFLLIGTTSIKVFNTGSGVDGSRYGCHLVSGSSHTSIELLGGSTNIGQFHDANLTVTNILVEDGLFYIGPNVLPTNFRMTGGQGTLELPTATTLTAGTLDGGHLTTLGAFVVTAFTMNGGTHICENTGAYTTYTANGGFLNLIYSKRTKEITTLVQDQAAKVWYDTAFLTNTTFTRNGPMESSSALTSVEPKSRGGRVAARG